MAKSAPARDVVSVEDFAYVSPQVVSWAIKRSRLTHESIADKLRIDVELLKSWERRGGQHPEFSKAQALAKLLHVPFGFFYLSEPPSADLPLPDFRGFDRSYKPTADLLEHLNDTLVKQAWFREHQEESASAQLKYVGSFTIRDDVDKVAASIRVRLGLTPKFRESASSWSEFLTALGRRAESAGVLVMRSGVVGNATNRPLRVEELQGFAIADPYAPVVFVNSADFRASQTFTLAHELAHLWIGATGIAKADELAEVVLNKTELFCNKVAAEVLVPRSDFETAWGQLSSAPDIRVEKMARKFWVSSYVTLRRAHELGKVNREQYERIKSQAANRRGKDDSAGGNYYRNVSTRMSHRLTDAVLGELVGGRLEWRDAASLLSMKVPTLEKFVEKWK